MELKNILLDVDVKRLREKTSAFGKDPLLLEKNENSDLVSVSKPPTQEFFEQVFGAAGPFWGTYADLGFASKPVDSTYVSFIEGQMFFLKNTEKRFISETGRETTYSIREGRLYEEKKKNLQNLMLLLSSPFDLVKQQASVIELGFMANEKVKEFESFTRETRDYWSRFHEKKIKDPVKTARESLKKAVDAMMFTSVAMLCYMLDVKLRRSDSIERCEGHRLRSLLEEKNIDSIRKELGFYSLAPYDITKPRFCDDTHDLEKYGAPEPPESYPLKWRENAKYLCARYLDIERRAYLELAEMSGLGEDVFYLRTAELEDPEKDLIAERRSRYNRYTTRTLPQRIVFSETQSFAEKNAFANPEIKGISVSSKRIATGRAVNINSYDDYEKCHDGDIIFSRSFSPNLTILYNKAAAVVSESGGKLAHSAIIAREMDLPCIVQASLPAPLKDGTSVEVNGTNGRIRII